MTLEEIVIECHLDGLSWFPGQARDLVFNTLAMVGEMGEFANKLKKCERGSLDYTDPEVRADLVFELTDAFTYMMNCFGIMNANPEEAYKIVRGKNIERWGKPDHAAAIQSLDGTNNGTGS